MYSKDRSGAYLKVKRITFHVLVMLKYGCFVNCMNMNWSEALPLCIIKAYYFPILACTKRPNMFCEHRHHCDIWSFMNQLYRLTHVYLDLRCCHVFFSAMFRVLLFACHFLYHVVKSLKVFCLYFPFIWLRRVQLSCSVGKQKWASLKMNGL